MWIDDFYWFFKINRALEKSHHLHERYEFIYNKYKLQGQNQYEGNIETTGTILKLCIRLFE